MKFGIIGLPDNAKENRNTNDAIAHHGIFFLENELQELEGDLHALTMIDLESNGLGEYKDYLASRKNNQLKKSNV